MKGNRASIVVGAGHFSFSKETRRGEEFSWKSAVQPCVWVATRSCHNAPAVSRAESSNRAVNGALRAYRPFCPKWRDRGEGIHRNDARRRRPPRFALRLSVSWRGSTLPLASEIIERARSIARGRSMPHYSYPATTRPPMDSTAQDFPTIARKPAFELSEARENKLHPGIDAASRSRT